ncbi:cysteine peptidase family C39 domain-containing protein [Haloferula chungangensis]|uniref:Cysteine peptidase family C39 domain-containing protein n=1 Tax=Haloferula chungangensis TaxID=1048331 RepID=A0ABW2L986_9BACT
MNPNGIGIISAILAFVAFALSYRYAKKESLKRRLILSFIAILLAIPGASFAAYYAHIFPETEGYYQFRSIPGTELLFVFIGIAGGLVASLLHRLMLVIPLFGVAAFSIVPLLKPIFGPIPEGSLSEKWDGKVCLQSTPSTCGAASTATILTYLGKPTTEAEIAADAHSYVGGTEAWYLARAIRARGYKAHFNLTKGFDEHAEFPALVGVTIGSLGHFIAILSKEGDRYHVGDPLVGDETLTEKELLIRYRFTGFYLPVSQR